MEEALCRAWIIRHRKEPADTLFAALDVLTGKVIGEYKQRHRHQEFLAFLKTVNKQTPKDKALHTDKLFVAKSG